MTEEIIDTNYILYPNKEIGNYGAKRNQLTNIKTIYTKFFLVKHLSLLKSLRFQEKWITLKENCVIIALNVKEIKQEEERQNC